MGGGGDLVGNIFKFMVFESSFWSQRRYFIIGSLTDRNHALAIVVQILKHHLAKGVDLLSDRRVRRLVRIMTLGGRRVHHRRPQVVVRSRPGPQLLVLLPGQEQALLLQVSKQVRHLAHNGRVAGEVVVLVQHDGEVEDELVAVVPRVLDAHRVRDDTEAVDAHGEQPVAELLAGYDQTLYRAEVEERLLPVAGHASDRDNGALRDLVQDMWPFTALVVGCGRWRAIAPFSGWNRAKNMALMFDISCTSLSTPRDYLTSEMKYAGRIMLKQSLME
jgi:hypothetical protein